MKNLTKLIVFLFCLTSQHNLSADIEIAKLNNLQVELSKNKSTINGGKKITCYTGKSFSSGNNIEYEIFPTLGFFHVRECDDTAKKTWLVIKTPANLKDKIIVNTNSQLSLSEPFKNMLLSVGSGLINQDILAVSLVCYEIDNYRIINYSISKDAFGIDIVSKILISQNAINREGIFYYSDNGIDWWQRSFAVKSLPTDGK
jgi:hypothetical protein